MQSTEWQHLAKVRRLAAAVCVLSTLALLLHLLTFIRTPLDHRRSLSSSHHMPFPEGDGQIIYDVLSVERPFADSNIDVSAVFVYMGGEEASVPENPAWHAFKHQVTVNAHIKSELESEGYPEGMRERLLALPPQGGLLRFKITPSPFGFGVRVVIAVALFLSANYALSIWRTLGRGTPA